MSTVDTYGNRLSWPPDLKSAGLPIEVPTIGKFSGSAEVVTGVKGLPGLAALQREDAVDLPAFQHLGVALLARDGVGGRKREAMTDVEIAVAVFALADSAVFGQILVPIVRLIVDCVR